jgi:hypothetical protein
MKSFLLKSLPILLTKLSLYGYDFPISRTHQCGAAVAERPKLVDVIGDPPVDLRSSKTAVPRSLGKI